MLCKNPCGGNQEVHSSANSNMRVLPSSLILALLACAARASVPIYDVDVVHTYPHDVSAYTEGLFYLNGFLYESTGLEQHSTIRKVRIDTGAVVQKIDVPEQYFGEGIVNWGRHLISLT